VRAHVFDAGGSFGDVIVNAEEIEEAEVDSFVDLDRLLEARDVGLQELAGGFVESIGVQLRLRRSVPPHHRPDRRKHQLYAKKNIYLIDFYFLKYYLFIL
jgi:hypothetical protein